MCPPMWAHWRHLTNTIEPSICGGDAVLCQITLIVWLLLLLFKVTLDTVVHVSYSRCQQVLLSNVLLKAGCGV